MQLKSVLDIDTSPFNAGLRSADTALRVFERSVGSSSAVIKDFATLMGGVGMTRLAAEALMAGDEMINLQRKLSVIANSLNELSAVQGKANAEVQTGAKVYGDLRKMAIDTSTSMKTLQHAWVQMTPVAAALGVEVKTVNNMIKGTIGAAALMGTSNQELDRAFVALRQILGKNQLQMEELRGQLGEALPTAMLIFAEGLTTIKRRSGDLSETAKITTVELNQMIQQGAIGGKLAAEAWEEGTKRYAKFADAQALVMSGQMRIMKTVFETGSGQFFADSGINRGIGVALKMANDNIDAWLQKQVKSAEAHGQRFIGGLLNAGGAVARHLDQTQDFHSEVGAILGGLAELAVQGSNAFWNAIPAEFREMGLLGLLLYGGRSVATFLGTMRVRTIALLGAILIGAIDQALPDGFFVKMGIRIAEGIAWVSNRISADAKTLSDTMSAPRGIEARKQQQIDAASRNDLSLADHTLAPEIPQEQKKPKQTAFGGRLEQGSWYWPELNEEYSGKPNQSGYEKFMEWRGERVARIQAERQTYVQAELDKYGDQGQGGKDLAEVVGRSKFGFDNLVGNITSAFGLFDEKVKVFEPNANMREFERSYENWAKNFKTQFAEAGKILDEMMGEGGLIKDATSKTLLKMTPQERQNALAAITGDMAANRADAPEYAAEAKINSVNATIEKRRLLMKRQDGVSEVDAWAEAFGGNKNAFGDYMKSMQLKKIGTLDDVKGLETVEATKKLSESLYSAAEKMGNEIEAQVGMADQAKDELHKKIADALRSLGHKTATALDQAAENELRKVLAENSISQRKEREVQAAHGSASKDLIDRTIAVNDPSLKNLLSLKEEEQRKRVELGLSTRDGSNSLKSDSELNAEARAEQNRQVSRTALQGKFDLNTYIQTKMVQQDLSNQQANLDIGAFRGNVSGYRDLMIEGKEAQLLLGIENSKLELELYDREESRSAMIEQEMMKLRLEEKTLHLQLEVMLQEDHRQQSIKNEMAKLELENAKIQEERALLKDKDLQKKKDDTAHYSSILKGEKIDDSTRQLGLKEKQEDDRINAVKEIYNGIQKTNNELIMMDTAEWKISDIEKTRIDLGKQIKEAAQQELRLLDEESIRKRNSLDIQQGINSNLETARRINLLNNNTEFQRVEREKAVLGILQEQASLKQQMRNFEDPRYGEGLNENAALSGDVEKMKLLNSYSMSFSQYMRVNAASAIKSFTDTFSTGLTKVITGQMRIKDLWKEIGQMIVGGAIKAIIEFALRTMIAKTAATLFGVEQEKNTETTVAGLAITTAAGVAAMMVSMMVGTMVAESLAAAWAPAAAGAAIATFGAAAAAGAVGLIITYSLAEALANGMGGMAGGAMGSLGSGGLQTAGANAGIATSPGMMDAFGGKFHDGGLFDAGGGVGRSFGQTALRSDEGYALLQHGEMIVPTRNVAATVAMMKMAGIPLPEGVYHSGGVFGGYTPSNESLSIGSDTMTDASMSSMKGRGIQVVNYFDFQEVERHLVRNPGSILNIMVTDKRNNGRTAKLYDRARR